MRDQRLAKIDVPLLFLGGLDIYPSLFLGQYARSSLSGLGQSSIAGMSPYLLI